MRVLLVGSGGREHALAWALAASPLLTKLWAAPGNPGIARHAECVPIEAMDLDGLVAFAQVERVELVVPGPEAPLVAGLADRMAAVGIACCGPSAAAARIEGSKGFAKEVCVGAGVGTARWERFEDRGAAREGVRGWGVPVVVKADGLAGGKGVVVAGTMEEAEAAVEALDTPLLIEECLVGPEVSLFALCDGLDAVFLGTARDHKRVGEGDTGPNTGGMGAISPAPGFDPAAAMEGIVRPVLAEMVRRGAPFRGVLFVGLMLTAEGPRVIEFNCRFGDPECQALLPRLRSDLLAGLVAACEGELGRFGLQWRGGASCAVVVAARGYPGVVRRGTAIGGLEGAEGLALVFQGGTRMEGEQLVADGGRVLTVVGVGGEREAARGVAYRAVDALEWEDGFARRDIGVG